MRKAIFIFIAFIPVAVSIDWIHSFADLKSHKEVFGRHLTYADMYEYKDKDYDYVDRRLANLGTPAPGVETRRVADTKGYV